MDYDKVNKMALVEQRNKMSIDDEIEIIGPDKKMFKQTIKEMWNEEGEAIESAPHPQQKVKIRMEKAVGEYDIFRREDKNND